MLVSSKCFRANLYSIQGWGDSVCVGTITSLILWRYVYVFVVAAGGGGRFIC